MAEQTFGPGAVLAGRYRLVAQIGEGGMGSVWRAEHLTLRSELAIKLIDTELASSQEVLTRFMREAQAAAALSSPHVVHIMDYGVEGEVPFIAMELMHGEDLAHRLERVGILSAAETARVITHASRAVGKAHEAGIVHRDLKPDNIFIVHNEDDEIAKVLDFGVAKAVDTGAQLGGSTDTRTGVVIGTPHYMSPEQARGDRQVDWRSDLWALAVIAYECLTGARPFDADGIGSLLVKICSDPIPVPSAVASVPPAFDDWFAKAAQRDPEQRFQSARELTDALQQALLGGAAVSSLPGAVISVPGSAVAASAGVPSTTDRVAATELVVAPEPSRGRGALVVGGVATAVVLVGAALVAGGGGQDSVPEEPSAAQLSAPVPTASVVDPAEPAPAPTSTDVALPDAAADAATESAATVQPSRVPAPGSQPRARRAAPRRGPRVSGPAAAPSPATLPSPAPAAPPKKRRRDIGF